MTRKKYHRFLQKFFNDDVIPMNCLHVVCDANDYLKNIMIHEAKTVEDEELWKSMYRIQLVSNILSCEDRLRLMML